MDGRVLEITGLDRVIAVINHFAAPGLQREAFPILGGLLESQTKDRFGKGLDPDGRPWAPWSKAYAATRRKGHGILLAGGHLRDSIAWQMDGDELKVGSNLDYAAIHQFGSGDMVVTVPAHERTNLFGREVAPFQVGAYQRHPNIPARPYAGVSEADAIEAEAALIEWLAASIPAGAA
jgi:phage virion morphogenesis protein